MCVRNYYGGTHLLSNLLPLIPTVCIEPHVLPENNDNDNVVIEETSASEKENIQTNNEMMHYFALDNLPTSQNTGLSNPHMPPSLQIFFSTMAVSSSKRIYEQFSNCISIIVSKSEEDATAVIEAILGILILIVRRY